MRRLLPVIVALLLLPATAHAATTTVAVIADTSVDASAPATNYGSDLLRIDGDPQRWALLQFQVPALSGTVTDARLRIHKRVGSPSQRWDVHAVPCSWTWNTVTWDTRPTLGAIVGTSPGYPAPGAGWADAALQPSAVSSGTLCLAATKPTASDIWISVDDLNQANPAQLVITTEATPPPPPPPPADTDGDGVPDSSDACPGTPAGTQVDATGCAIVTPPPPSPVAKCGGTPVDVTPSTMASVIGSRNSVTINAHPGTYSSLSMHKRTSDSCVEIHCTVAASIGEQANPNGCLIAGESTIESIKNLTIEGFVVKTTGAETYGFALYDESPHVGMNTRIADNVFDDSTDHDISTKERESYTEVIDNIFLHCRRHCWEIGQNGNIPSRPSTTTTSVFRGNIVHSTINGITQRYNLNLLVEGNDFRGEGGYAVNNWPFWAIYLGEYNMVPGTYSASSTAYVPLRTTIRNNRFAGHSALRFTGRGVTDDVVLIQGNTGITSCARGSMDSQNSGTSAAHSNEQTTAPPRLDPASDVTCP